jgi:hypothetical protein
MQTFAHKENKCRSAVLQHLLLRFSTVKVRHVAPYKCRTSAVPAVLCAPSHLTPPAPRRICPKPQGTPGHRLAPSSGGCNGAHPALHSGHSARVQRRTATATPGPLSPLCGRPARSCTTRTKSDGVPAQRSATAGNCSGLGLSARPQPICKRRAPPASRGHLARTGTTADPKRTGSGLMAIGHLGAAA